MTMQSSGRKFDVLFRHLALVLLAGVSLCAFGQETRYVADNIPIMLRSGPTLRNKILQTLSAGDKVQILESDAESGYSHVRVVSDGTDGWLLTRYLTGQPVARDLLAAAQRKLADAQAQVSDLQSKVESLTGQVQQTSTQLQQVTSSNQDVTSQLQNIRRVSSNAIQLHDENESLKQRMADSEQRINRLTMKNTELESQNRQQWFLAGAAVLIVGVVIGIVAPHTKRKRRSTW